MSNLKFHINEIYDFINNSGGSETTQEKDTLNKQNENDYNQSPKEVNNINEQPKNKNIFKIVISVCLVVITIVVIISAIGVNSGTQCAIIVLLFFPNKLYLSYASA